MGRRPWREIANDSYFGFYVRSQCHDLGKAVRSLGVLAPFLIFDKGQFELGKNVLAYGDLSRGEDVWGPKVNGNARGLEPKQQSLIGRYCPMSVLARFENWLRLPNRGQKDCALNTISAVRASAMDRLRLIITIRGDVISSK